MWNARRRSGNSAAEAFLAVNSGQLAMGSLLTGTAGLVKGLPGTLLLNSPGNRVGIANLSGQTLTGNVAVDAGTLKLGGGNNTLTPNQFLIVAPGATLDLNGTSQFAFGTRGDGAAQQGNAGTFTNSGAGAAALILGADNGGVNFGGVIKQEAAAGAMNFFKGSGQTYNFYNANTYSGATVFAGGTNELRDGGTLANTSSIDLNYARLTFNDDVTFALANRVNLAAPITMRGGSLVYGNGRAQTETTQAVGNVTLVEGQNMIQAINGGTGVNSAVLTLASLARSGGSTATLRFPDANAPGTIGNSGRILITSPLTLSNNLIGPWAVVDREFASNIPTLGVGRLNQVGFAGYSVNFLNRQPLATDNIRATLNVPGLAVDTTVNTLAVNVNVPATTIDLGGRQLTLASGGLILAVNADNQTISLQNGTITSGAAGVGGDLYLHALNYAGANRTFTVSAGITNNGGGAVRLIKASGAVDAASDFLVLSGTSLNFGGSIVVGGATTAGSNTVIVTNATGITLGMAVTGNGLPAGEVVTGILGNTVTITTGTGVTTTAGNNTYTGGTVINGGNLLVGPGGNIPAGGITINGGDVSGVGTILQDVNGVITRRTP